MVTVLRSTPRQLVARVAIYSLLVLAFAPGLWLRFASDHTLPLFWSLFCPADTLVTDSFDAGALWLGGSTFLAGLGFMALICLFLPAAEHPRPADILLARRRRIGSIAGGCLLAIASAMAACALSSFYCATPRGIFLHATPFGAGRIYAWTDVSRITAECYRRRLLTTWFYFDLVMTDDRTISLGNDALIRNYRAVSDALRDVPSPTIIHGRRTAGARCESCWRRGRVPVLSSCRSDPKEMSRDA
jgi:hypothetical protein